MLHLYKKSVISGKKSQVNVIDLFASVFIFCVLIMTVMLTWNNYGEKIDKKAEYQDMMTKAFQISNTLIKTAGHPNYWTSENVRVIGLASQDRVLSQEKIDAFIAMDVNKTKEIWQTYGYNFYFTIQSVGSNITYGLEPSGNKSVAIIDYVLLEDEKAVTHFYLWK